MRKRRPREHTLYKIIKKLIPDYFSDYILRPTVQNSFPCALNELNKRDNNIKFNDSFPDFKKSFLKYIIKAPFISYTLSSEWIILALLKLNVSCLNQHLFGRSKSL